MKSLWLKLGVIVFWLAWPALWLYLQFTSRTRVLLFDGDRFLVVRGWMSDGRWQLPGGGMHRGERPEDGLRRELLEETGISVRPDRVNLISEEPYKSRGFRFNCFYYTARPEHPVQVVLSGVEISAATWMTRDEVSDKTCGYDVIRALEILDKKY